MAAAGRRCGSDVCTSSMGRLAAALIRKCGRQHWWITQVACLAAASVLALAIRTHSPPPRAAGASRGGAGLAVAAPRHCARHALGGGCKWEGAIAIGQTCWQQGDDGSRGDPEVSMGASAPHRPMRAGADLLRVGTAGPAPPLRTHLHPSTCQWRRWCTEWHRMTGSTLRRWRSNSGKHLCLHKFEHGRGRGRTAGWHASLSMATASAGAAAVEGSCRLPAWVTSCAASRDNTVANTLNT